MKPGMDGLRKRSINLSGHATSLALEAEFWAGLEEMAQRRGRSLAGVIGEIDEGREGRPLASACRLAVLRELRAAADMARRPEPNTPS